jgi:hypothetical protein
LPGVAASVPASPPLGGHRVKASEAEGDKEELKEDGSEECLLPVWRLRARHRYHIAAMCVPVLEHGQGAAVWPVARCVAPARSPGGRRVVPPGPCRDMGQPWRERPPSCTRCLTPGAPPEVVHVTAAPGQCPAKRHVIGPPFHRAIAVASRRVSAPNLSRLARGHRCRIAAKGVRVPVMKARTRGISSATSRV